MSCKERSRGNSVLPASLHDNLRREQLLVFLDTEFTDFNHPALISMGLVTESEEEFYVEVPFPVDACSDFVHATVIPLLNQYPDAFCPVQDLRLRVLKWLEIVKRTGEDIEICVDFETDWELFAHALDMRVPTWCKPRHVGRNINELLLYSYHQQTGLPEHHALYDARAARYAFRDRPAVAT